MKTTKRKTTPVKLEFSIESPTWGDLHMLGKRVMEILGGPERAAMQLSPRAFYTLAILSSLMLNDEKSRSPILGKRHIT